MDLGGLPCPPSAPFVKGADSSAFILAFPCEPPFSFPSLSSRWYFLWALEESSRCLRGNFLTAAEGEEGRDGEYIGSECDDHISRISFEV